MKKGMDFEEIVRQVARALRPVAGVAGRGHIGGKEFDGVYKTEDLIHIVEATISKKKSKVLEDANKIVKTARKHFRREFVKGWIITAEEPTVEQKKAIEDLSRRIRDINIKIEIMSLDHFRRKLIDVADYLSQRQKHGFGSVYSLRGESEDPDISYVQLDIMDENGQLWNVKGLAEGLVDGNRFLLLGDYGAGKSMTLREIFLILSEYYRKGQIKCFPIYINLREHRGQRDPSEVLLRHGNIIGFSNPSHLIRAWKGGMVILILDGFDEVGTYGIQGRWQKLQEVRFRATEVIRKFMRSSEDVGIIVAGRQYYFDSENEMNKALGSEGDGRCAKLLLSDFSDEQMLQYLTKLCDKMEVEIPASGLQDVLPFWLPRRPLLLGYLAVRQILPVLYNNSQCDPRYKNILNNPIIGWDYLIDMLCQRETRIEAGLDAETIRRILERLSTYARRFFDGIGPIPQDAILETFSQVCGYEPDEDALVIVQRLPGLCVHPEQDRDNPNQRSFIDVELAQALQIGDVLRFCLSPDASTEADYNKEYFERMERTIEAAVAAVISEKLRESKVTAKQLTHSIKVANKKGLKVLAGDLALAAIAGGIQLSENIYITDIAIPKIVITDISVLHNISFHECIIGAIIFDTNRPLGDPIGNFHNCCVEQVVGVSSGMAHRIFKTCEISGIVEDEITTKTIRQKDLSEPEKVLLTILRKLFLLPGSGRVESALRRGLTPEQSRYVTDILRILKTMGYAKEYRRKGATIWLPERGKSADITRLIYGYSFENHPLVAKVNQL